MNDATDCNDATSSVNPGVGEVCDAGDVDENCDGVANPSTLCSCTGTEQRACTLPGVCALRHRDLQRRRLGQLLHRADERDLQRAERRLRRRHGRGPDGHLL